jgi:transposase InsO family protein
VARIKDARMERIPGVRRPHYTPEERLQILTLRALHGWTAAETARRFLVSDATIAEWMHRLDEEGTDALVQVRKPVNRFPEFVRVIVRELRASLPSMGKVRIAQILARAGVHLAASTVKRMIRERTEAPAPPPSPSDTSSEVAGEKTSEREKRAQSGRTVAARHPHHVWNIDFTIVPTVAGLWVQWFPFACLQCWPFVWWVAVVVDHFSRAVVRAEAFRKEPTAADLCALLDRAVTETGRAPKYTVTDQGVQFRKEFREWCARRNVSPRFGAIGKHGSIALVERFMRTLKDEGFRKILVPFGIEEVRSELAATVRWYNEHRPHRALHGATPAEVCDGRIPANEKPGLETRTRYPLARSGAKGLARRCAKPFVLDMTFVDGRKHLPIVALKRAA